MDDKTSTTPARNVPDRLRVTWLPLARAATVWLTVLVGIIYLYRTGSGGGDAPALAESLEHKLAIAEAGRVAVIEAQPGQRVTKGQVLVRLSTDEIDSQIQVLRADLDRTRSAVEAGATSLASNAFNDERSLNIELLSARQAEIELRSAEARDRAELSQLLAELTKEQSLVQSGLVRNDRMLELQARIPPLEEQLKNVQPRLAAARGRVVQTGERLSQWRSRFGPNADGRPSDVQVQPLRDAVQAKTAELQGLTDRRQRMAITAPVDGHVTALQARTGDVVKQGDPVMVVTAATPSQLIAYVVERNRLNLQQGQRVTVQRNTGGTNAAALEGRVRAIATAVTPMPSRLWSGPQMAAWGREVYIDVPANAGLQPGEQVQVRFMEPEFSLNVLKQASAASAPQP